MICRCYSWLTSQSSTSMLTDIWTHLELYATTPICSIHFESNLSDFFWLVHFVSLGVDISSPLLLTDLGYIPIGSMACIYHTYQKLEWPCWCIGCDIVWFQVCFQLYVPVFSMSWYGYRYLGHCTLVSSTHNRIANRTGFSVHVVTCQNFTILASMFVWRFVTCQNFQFWQVCSSDGLSVCLFVCLSV